MYRSFSQFSKGKLKFHVLAQLWEKMYAARIDKLLLTLMPRWRLGKMILRITIYWFMTINGALTCKIRLISLWLIKNICKNALYYSLIVHCPQGATVTLVNATFYKSGPHTYFPITWPRHGI